MSDYLVDGRLPLRELYQDYNLLKTVYNWQIETIFEQPGEWPIVSFRTPQIGPALWIIAGIHGEEPAGPQAVAAQIDILATLARQGVPMVVIPMANPRGYRLDWRYPNEHRDVDKGHSVGDADHYLFSLDNPTKPRQAQSISPIAAAFTQHVLKLTEKYPPLLVLDHHEDEDVDKPYIYAHGTGPATTTIAHRVVDLLSYHGVDLKMSGTTRFGESIDYGIVLDAHDGSVDELLASEHIILNGELITKSAAQTVIVIETPSLLLPLATRIAAHSSIIEALPEFLQIIKKTA